MTKVISGWTRVPLLVLIDRDLPADIKASVKALLLEARTVEIPFRSDAILDKIAILRKEGYHRRFSLDYPFEVSTCSMERAALLVFEDHCPGLNLSVDAPAGYGTIDHWVKNEQDYVRIFLNYMAYQDPETLNLLFSTRTPPNGAFMEVPWGVDNAAIVAMAKTAAIGVVVATENVGKLPEADYLEVVTYKQKQKKYAEEVLGAVSGLYPVVVKTIPVEPR